MTGHKPSNEPTRTQPSELTLLLQKMGKGDRDAGAQAIDLVYSELHRIASSQMRNEKKGHILQTTALVHEAFVKLTGGGDVEIQNRAHFYAVASQQMRRILVDYARAAHSQRRGGGAEHVDLDHLQLGSEPQKLDLLWLDQTLKELESVDPRAARVIELRYFGGYTDKEMAIALDVSLATVRRDWGFAKAWLFDRLQSQPKGHTADNSV